MDYARQQRRPAKHLVGLTAVVGMHLALVWALQNGLAHKVMTIAKKPIDAKLIEEVKPKEPAAAPPPPNPKKPPPPPEYVPPPEVSLPPAVAAPANAISAITRAAPPAEAPPPAPPRAAVRVQPEVSASSCEKPEYPAASRRLEETGTVVLRFLIAEEGRVVDSRIEKSSGSPRLDEAARSALSRCKFKPGTVDGQPEQSWASMKYTWRLD